MWIIQRSEEYIRMILKACSRCGKVHPKDYKCNYGQKYEHHGEPAKIRSQYDWKQKSLYIREQAKYMCEYCFSMGVITTEGLSVHHIEKLSDRPDLAYNNTNLICLCSLHHQQAEDGTISKEILKKIAGDRDKSSPYVF